MKRITEKFGNLYRQKLIIHHHQDVFATQAGNNKNPANCTSCVRPKEMKFYKEMRSLMKRITEKFGNLYRQKLIIHHHQDVFATQEEITKIQLIVQLRSA